MKFSQFSTPAMLFAVSALLLQGCAPLSTRIANAVYPALDEPWDPEPPPTAGTYPASTEIRAVIAGRGEGLSCSIPALAESLMFKGDPNKPKVMLDFRQACVTHDFCYRHGHATYGYTKSDCDVVLQEHAYRICLKYQGNTSREECQERARVVLLGLNLFGGRNFLHGHKSTFFEFDPFPQRANNYVVGRLAAHRDLSDEVTTTAAAGRDRSLWTFYFKDGWMTVRDRLFRRPCNDPKVNTPDCVVKPAAAVPFLYEKVPVPPQIVRAAEGDRYVWMARRSLVNTGIHVLSAEATSAQKLVGALSTVMGNPATERTGCNSNDQRNRPNQSTAVLEFDCDARVSRVVAFQCSSGRWRTAVVAQGSLHHAPDLCSDTGNEIGLISHQVRSMVLREGRRPLLQNEFIFGNFGSEAVLDLVAVGRGTPAASHDQPAGYGFVKELAVARQPIFGQQASMAEVILGFEESMEPLAPYRGEAEKFDQLLGLHSSCAESQDCQVNVAGWSPQAKWEHTGTKSIVYVPLSGKDGKVLGSDWLRQPAHVVASASALHSDWLVFSRVDSSSGRDTLDNPSLIPTAVKLEYKGFRRYDKTWKEEAHSCIRVDLRKQLAAPDASVTLINRYFRNDKEQVNRRACLAGNPPANADAAAACTALLRDVAARWHRSQVIPAYIRKLDRNEPARKPDAMFVFNGFPEFSVMVGSDMKADRDWAVPCASPG